MVNIKKENYKEKKDMHKIGCIKTGGEKHFGKILFDPAGFELGLSASYSSVLTTTPTVWWLFVSTNFGIWTPLRPFSGGCFAKSFKNTTSRNYVELKLAYLQFIGNSCGCPVSHLQDFVVWLDLTCLKSLIIHEKHKGKSQPRTQGIISAKRENF